MLSFYLSVVLQKSTSPTFILVTLLHIVQQSRSNISLHSFSLSIIIALLLMGNNSVRLLCWAVGKGKPKWTWQRVNQKLELKEDEMLCRAEGTLKSLGDHPLWVSHYKPPLLQST